MDAYYFDNFVAVTHCVRLLSPALVCEEQDYKLHLERTCHGPDPLQAILALRATVVKTLKV